MSGTAQVVSDLIMSNIQGCMAACIIHNVTARFIDQQDFIICYNINSAMNIFAAFSLLYVACIIVCICYFMLQLFFI